MLSHHATIETAVVLKKWAIYLNVTYRRQTAHPRVPDAFPERRIGLRLGASYCRVWLWCWRATFYRLNFKHPGLRVTEFSRIQAEHRPTR